ncbi:TIGR03086 family metal-binding protein [Kitasatospora sp. NPDC058965]|uniref:TIGR03086 family metal-binding protein n=1 Tax=Kitasatospora sp. NPDC058965 TaxID=3346682 RepID=UPI0036764BAB
MTGPTATAPPQPTPADVLSLHAEAVASFGRRVAGVAANQWSAPTPCTAWSVRDLVNHLTTEQLWVPELLLGATVAEVGDRFDGDRLGDDPVASWTAAAAAARAALELPDALELVVHLSYGDRSAQEYCAELTVDLTVHTWDLARATGQDARLAPELVAFALHEVTPYADQLSDTGYFDPPVPAAADADPQTRLLALLGRRTDNQPRIDPEVMG